MYWGFKKISLSLFVIALSLYVSPLPYAFAANMGKIKLTPKDIKNAEYFIPNAGTRVKLTNGTGKTGSGKNDDNYLEIWTNTFKFGDLNGDGLQDATVILSNNNGMSSHVFYDLAVVINKDGRPYNVTTEDLGDNIVIESLSIKNGEIILRMKVHGTDDPACCPSTKKVVKYVLLNGKLTSKGIDKVGTPEVPLASEQHKEANSIQNDPYMAFVK